MAIYNKSYDEILNRLIELSKKSLPRFTSYSDSDPFIILLKLISAMSVSSNKYVKKYFNSKFIQQTSVMDDKSLYLLLEAFNKTPEPIIAGVVEVTMEYIGNLMSDQITIPEGTVFLVGETPFTVFEDYYLKSYASYINMTLIEGKLKTEEFYGSAISNYRVQLNSDKVSMRHVRVYVDNKEYSIDNHVDYSTQEGVFSVEYDMFSHYNIVFPSNYTEFISDGSIIRVVYIESTGTQDYDASTSDIIISTPIYYDTTNISPLFKLNVVYGYYDSDTGFTENYNYSKLPTLITTYDKAITTEDYEYLTNFYRGVAISAAYDINSELHTDPAINIRSPFHTKIVVAPKYGYYLNESSKDALLEYLRENGLSEEELTLELLDPKYVTIDLSFGIKVNTTRDSELLNIYSSVTALMKEYFRVGNIKFGSYISADYICTMISKSDPIIDYVDALNFYGYQLAADELPILGKLDITFAYASISVGDNMYIVDKVHGTEVTNRKLDALNITDNPIDYILHPLTEEMGVTEVKRFVYDNKFDISISQELNIILKDELVSKRNISISATTKVYTTYEIQPTTDSDKFADDEPRFNSSAIITDRGPSFSITYNY